MDFRLMDVEGPVGNAPEVHRDAAGFVDYVVEHPADGPPELIWIIDDDNRVVVFNDSDESSEEEDFDEDQDDRSTSEDSGYSSMEEDEDMEDGQEEDIRPPSPRVQLPPTPAGAPVMAAPPQEDPADHIISFPKRPWEESDVEAQVGTKRQRTSEEDDEQPGPSTPRSASSTNHSTSGPSTSGLSSSVRSGHWFRPSWSQDDSDSD